MTDEFATRASVFAINRDGYMSDGTSDDEHWSGRLQTLWEPNDKISWQVQGQYAKYEGKGQGFSYAGADDPWDSIYPGGNQVIADNIVEDGLVVPSFVFPWLTGPVVGELAPGVNLISLVNPVENDATQNMKFWDVSSTFTWDIDFATLTAIPAYQKAEMYYVAHPGLRYETGDPLAFDSPEKSEATSLEVRLSDETDDFKWVAGVNVYHETQEANVYVNQGAAQNTAVKSDYKAESLGIFGESTMA